MCVNIFSAKHVYLRKFDFYTFILSMKTKKSKLEKYENKI